MNTFFCAEESRQAGEDIIGNGEISPIYVLIECPTPWTANALNSKFIPANLRALQKELEQAEFPINFLLIYNENLKQVNSTKFIIYRQKFGFSNGYTKQEFNVPDINEVAPALKQCLLDDNLAHQNTENQTRDILVCTHGSRDKCCAKYGNTFYRQALTTVANLSLNHIRIWQTTHFGGHRFAPTAIDFPEGRYYGRLDQASFTSILTRTGDIKSLKNVYRGWGILPYPAQILEREMMMMYGWDWFSYKLACEIVDQNEDNSFHRIELSFKKTDDLGSVQADVILDESKTLQLIGDCHSKHAEKLPQFTVKNIVHCQPENMKLY